MDCRSSNPAFILVHCYSPRPSVATWWLVDLGLSQHAIFPLWFPSKVGWVVTDLVDSLILRLLMRISIDALWAHWNAVLVWIKTVGIAIYNVLHRAQVKDHCPIGIVP
ncbi:hypothetical protein [Marininema mesophilum]|uniref:hypothetical protein n=1 Tax=Marininema mesophilum TaxID=1048340 RepID=UPI00115FD280|nr:hypothetical protein [Marininema mesophilum]